MFKPKFAPKIPVKSEPGETAPSSSNSASAPSASTNITNNAANNKGDGGRDKARVKREGGGDRQNRGGRGAGGRGMGSAPWTMPAGTAFFTGNAPAQLAAKINQAIMIPVKSEAKKASGLGMGRIARPNEAIDDDVMQAVGDKPPSSSNYLPPEPDLEDSDSDRSEEDLTSSSAPALAHAPHLTETWPPQRYNALDPLSLPFGPKSAQLRKALGKAAILAPPEDLEALDEEERATLFLLQMPSDLRAATEKSERKRGGVGSVSGGSAGGGGTNCLLDEHGRLGKLQLLRSGKVRLVTNEGKSFDVRNGLTACFLQSVLTVTVDVTQNNAQSDSNATTSQGVEGSHSEHSNSTSSAKRKSKEVSATSLSASENSQSIGGSMHFMGNVTKKLVLTPNYELGVRRKRSSSVSQQQQQQRQKERAAQEALLGRARAGSEIIGGEEELEEEFAAMDSMMVMDVGE